MLNATLSPLVASQFPRVHGCGRTVLDHAAWVALPYGYHQAFEDGEVHESRVCACGSHLVLVLAEPKTEAA